MGTKRTKMYRVTLITELTETCLWYEPSFQVPTDSHKGFDKKRISVFEMHFVGRSIQTVKSSAIKFTVVSVWTSIVNQFNL